MGLTESNQSRSGFWGAPKSKSTHQFVEGRYEGKPRQAATLPARPLTHSRSSPPSSLSARAEENYLSIAHSRPPDRPKYRNRSLQRDHRRETGNDRALLPSSLTTPAVCADRKKKRQSDPLLEFSDSNSLATVYKERGCFPIDKHDRIPSCITPCSAPPFPLRPTTVYSTDENVVSNPQPRNSGHRSRSGRRQGSSSSSRRGSGKDDAFSFKEKETQTNSVSVPSSSFYSEKERRRSRSNQRHNDGFPFPHPIELVSVRNTQSNGKRANDLFKKSRSVPTTPSEVKSDPYICLHYGNNIYSKPFLESEHSDQTKLNPVSVRPIYPDAYRPGKVNEIMPQPQPKCLSNPPVNKRSQIFIRVDGNEMNKNNNRNVANGNSELIELSDNVWFESKRQSMKKENQDFEFYDNIQPTCEQPKSGNMSFVPINSQPIMNNEAVAEFNNYYHGEAEELFFNSEDSGPERLINGLSFHSSKASNDQSEKRQSNLVINSNPRFNHLPEGYSEEGGTSTCRNSGIHAINVEQEPLKTCPSSFALQNEFLPIPELWLTEDDNYANEIGGFSERKAIPVSVRDANDSVDSGDLYVEERLKPSSENLFEWNYNQYLRDKDKEQDSITPNASSQNLRENERFFNLSEHPVKRRATLPAYSSSRSGSNRNELQSYTDTDHPELLRRKTIHIVNVGTFPVLRLPKLESQPRLVDVLRQANMRGNTDPNGDEYNPSLPLHEDALLADSKIGTSQKYSPLDENILYITDGFDESNPYESHNLRNEIDRINPSNLDCGDTNNRNDLLYATNFSNQINEQGKVVSPTDSDITHYDNTVYNIVENPMRENCSLLDHTKNPSGSPHTIEKEVTSISPVSQWGFKCQTFPVRKDTRKKREKLKHFFSFTFKPRASKGNNSQDCSLTCHEQCQNVVSLDCKATSPDDEVLLIEPFPAEVAAQDAEDTLKRDSDEGEQGLEDVTAEEEMKNSADSVSEEEEHRSEEEKHEEEKQEKEIIEEQEWATLKKSEETSTLRRTVYRIQSQAVDSSKIEEWVQKCPLTNVGLQIAKENDGEYRGCLRIHLNLSRPINIVAGTRPPSIYDILQEDRTMEKTLTSFYMPRDAIKAIHITSKTTTREVIVALLRKFKVVDNPHKFALYERTYDTGQSLRAKLRRLSDSECPLVLAIAWNAQGLTNKRLVLQENDTADIQWEAFSLPELDNFLRILDREEGEYKNQIKDKYALLRQRIQSQLARIAPVNT